jgi:hypothetical protein
MTAFGLSYFTLRRRQRIPAATVTLSLASDVYADGEFGTIPVFSWRR